jgi:hypothetical protein
MNYRSQNLAVCMLLGRSGYVRSFRTLQLKSGNVEDLTYYLLSYRISQTIRQVEGVTSGYA